MFETALRDWFPAIVAASIIGLTWLFQWYQRRPVKDPPKGTPYTIYTTEFDRVLTATGLSNSLNSTSPDFTKGFVKRDASEWDQAVADAEKITESLSEPASSTSIPSNFSGSAAVLLLVDQSGSMKGQAMAFTAAGLRKLTIIFQDCGIATEVIGFTTAGWRGGFVRQKWVESGRPSRPGRLCALLHIIYKSFDETEFSENAWREMLNPDVLRENIDGEALEFAEARLLERQESSRILVVISDGAPVDDSTLTQNGPSFLYRHVTETISRIQTESSIRLCGIGINHSVGEWYESSARVDDGKSLVNAVLRLIGELKPPSPA
jgi:cobaltochelatase CobT